MIIAGREIGLHHPPYVIAEISCNHGGNLGRALKLISAAKTCGADAVKFQAVEADKITIDSKRSEFTIQDGPWKGQNLYQLYTKTQTPFDWFPKIKEHAEKIGITWFASVFDKTAVDLMVRLDAPAIKVASFEIVDVGLIQHAAATGKPLILSTGMANYREVSDAIRAIGQYKFESHALLHCVSGYPTPTDQANLLRLKYGIRHGFIDGISDHSVGPVIPIAAVACGAHIIEKHFKLSYYPDTEDSAFSLDELDFASMVKNVRDTWDAMLPASVEVENSSRPFRRSLFAVADIPRGAIFSEKNIRSIRPGHGAPPIALPQFIGKRTAREIKRGEPLNFDMIHVSEVMIQSARK
jgi:N-acetylneuraminate synthase